jgi:hypothetical protein
MSRWVLTGGNFLFQVFDDLQVVGEHLLFLVVEEEEFFGEVFGLGLELGVVLGDVLDSLLQVFYCLLVVFDHSVELLFVKGLQLLDLFSQ